MRYMIFSLQYSSSCKIHPGTPLLTFDPAGHFVTRLVPGLLTQNCNITTIHLATYIRAYTVYESWCIGICFHTFSHRIGTTHVRNYKIRLYRTFSRRLILCSLNLPFPRQPWVQETGCRNSTLFLTGLEPHMFVIIKYVYQNIFTQIDPLQPQFTISKTALGTGSRVVGIACSRSPSPTWLYFTCTRTAFVGGNFSSAYYFLLNKNHCSSFTIVINWVQGTYKWHMYSSSILDTPCELKFQGF